MGGYDKLVFNLCTVTEVCPAAFASLYEVDPVDEPCLALTGGQDSDIQVGFYENSNLTDFNTSIMEFNYNATGTTSSNGLRGSLTGFRVLLICDDHYKDLPQIELNETDGSPKYIVSIRHDDCMN